MKNKTLVLLSLLLLFSCNKVKKVEKKIAGNWTVISYTFQNSTGLSYKYNCEGEFSFDNCSEEFCPYLFSFTYQVNGTSTTKQSKGLYQIEKDAEYFTFLRENNDGTISKLEDNRILLLTRDEFKMLIQDEDGVHHFVLEKN
ncbi:MAG TPA: hypothetical protein EYG86_08955 [Crocinitomicaceae bacterium]|nr:hypothetical protein [Crocinitomicaceae bacterium]